MIKNVLPDWMLGQYFAFAFKVVLALCVVAFVGMHSITFFEFIFMGKNSPYAYLGFALTGGSVIAYLAIIKAGYLTRLQMFTAVGMLVISVIGELATAGYGMRLESYTKLGMEFTKDDVDNMVLAVQGLALFHAIALILSTVGDTVISAFMEISSKEIEQAPLTLSSPLSSPPPPSLMGFSPTSKIENGKHYEQVLEWREVVVAPLEVGDKERAFPKAP